MAEEKDGEPAPQCAPRHTLPVRADLILTDLFMSLVLQELAHSATPGDEEAKEVGTEGYLHVLRSIQARVHTTGPRLGFQTYYYTYTSSSTVYHKL